MCVIMCVCDISLSCFAWRPRSGACSRTRCPPLLRCCRLATGTFGELVRKLGERILPKRFPYFEQGLDSEDSAKRQGVCIALGEIVSSTSRDNLEQYSASLLPAVRRALADPLGPVRAAAAKTFAGLHSTLGGTAITEVVPDLLATLEDETRAPYALDGLRHVMEAKARAVLPFLVPRLIGDMSEANARALAQLTAVAGPALTRHLGEIIQALLAAVQERPEAERKGLQEATCQVGGGRRERNGCLRGRCAKGMGGHVMIHY